MRTRADALQVLREARELLAAQPHADTFDLSREELLKLLSLCDEREDAK